MSRARPILIELTALLSALCVMAATATACGSGGTSTSLTTSLSGESKEGETLTVNEGSGIKDHATLSGSKASKATGTVKYYVYSESSCKTLVAEAGTVTVSSGSVPASSEETLTGGASYYWQAVYSGDSENAGSTSTCGKEVSTVKAATSLSTSLSGESKEGETLTVNEGSAVKDKATLSGTKSSTATGTVKYKVYADSECKELVASAGEVTVTSGSVPASSEETLTGGASYYWQASYGGDSLHQASTSTCSKEVLTVKAATSLATSLSGESKEGETLTVNEGSAVKDKATLSGTKSSTATGTVKYKVYSDSECKTLATSAGEVTVTSGSVPASSEETLTAGASYYWQASYSGDSLHQASTSACGKEVSTVKAATSLATSLSGEGESGEEISTKEGAPVHDEATLSGVAASMASGTVKYDIYSDNECKELVAEAGEVTVTGGIVPASSEKTLPIGAYYWQAVYSGDGLNEASASACGSEISVVKAAVTTSLSGEGQSGEGIEVDEGSAVTDKATLHSEHAATATGTVKYKVYSDDKCKELVTEAGEVTVTSGVVPASSAETLSAGTYYWQADYSGDSKNPAADSVCGAEISVVESSTSLTTSLSGEGHSGGEITVKEEAAVSDAATLSGSKASTASGYVRYDVYSDSECKELFAEAGDVSVTSGSVPKSEEEELPVGTYYWQAVYSGDGTNHSSTSTCGSEISVVTAPVTAALSGGEQSGDEVEVEEAESVTDTATLHGEHASIATGTVKYMVYSDPECKEPVAEAGEVTVSGASVPASSKETLAAGDYYWQAEYSGDSNNPAGKSVCGTDVDVVKPANGQYAAIGDSYSSGEGTITPPKAYYSRTNEAANECHRSGWAYPARVAEVLYPGLPVTEESEVLKQQPKFIFRACFGAVAENLWGSGAAGGQFNEWIEGTPGRWLTTPAQDLWLELPGGELIEPPKPNNNITLVTLTIGGNDSGFAVVASNCVDSDSRVVNFRTGYSQARCNQVIREWETGVPGATNPTLTIPSRREGIPSLATKLPVVLKDIHVSAPKARIRMLLYPQVLDTNVNGNIPVGATTVPFVGRVNLFIDNNPRANNIGLALERFVAALNQRLANTVKTWATKEKVDAKIVPGTVNAFNGHRLGDEPAELWMNGVILQNNVPATESFHPNCPGHIALARKVVQSLGRAPLAWTC
jgi:hypothetical protein